MEREFEGEIKGRKRNIQVRGLNERCRGEREVREGGSGWERGKRWKEEAEEGMRREEYEGKGEMEGGY